MAEDNRFDTENYLLTLASRLVNARAVVVVVEENDGTISYHASKFSDSSMWAGMIGGLYSVLHGLVNGKMVWAPCNPDGSDTEGDQ